MNIKTISTTIALCAASLSAVYTLVELRRDCGATSLFDCVMQAAGLGGAAQTNQGTAAQRARQLADAVDQQRQEAERRAHAATLALSTSEARRRELESRLLSGANSFAAVQAPASPTCSGRTLWSHNGSTLYLIADGDKRELHYLRPREGLVAENVQRGTLLFYGRRSGDRYDGVAYNFSRKCGVRSYQVSGVVDNNRRIVLTGIATRINSATCASIDSFVDKLEFDYMGCE